ncbi:MAG: DUF973 family protein [Conexivisphaera sp.]
MSQAHPRELVSSGARALLWSMLVGLIGGVIALMAGAALAVGTYLSAGLGSSYFGQQPIPPDLLSHIYPALAAIVGISAVVGVVVLVLQWIGWSRLRDADRFRYGIGRTGIVLLTIGFVLLVATYAVALVTIFPSLMEYMGSAPTYPPYYGSAGMLAGALAASGLMLIGALLALVGQVMIWIGLWRLDEDYGSGLIRASIIIELITVAVAFVTFVSADIAFAAIALDVVSYILMIVGLRAVSIRARAFAAAPAVSQA